MMKRTLALPLALVMALLLVLAGCGNTISDAAVEAAEEGVAKAAGEAREENLEAGELTAESLLEKMYDNLENVSSMSLDMDYTMEMTVEEEPFALSVNYAIDVTNDPQAAYILLTTEYEGDSLVMEVYTVEEDGGFVTYSGSDGEWYKAAAGDTEDLIEYAMLDEAANCTLAEETQLIDGVECYVLAWQMDGSLLADVFAAIGLEDLVDGVDAAALTLEETFYVDTDTLLPVQGSVDFGDSLRVISESALAQAYGISIESCVAAVSYTGFNNVDAITVPADVIASAVSYDELLSDAELKVNDDGTYVLEDWMYVYEEDAGEYVYGNITVNIAVPAGHTIDDYTSDSTWLCFDAETEDYNESAWVYYSLYADFTAEDMAYYYSGDFDDYADYYDGVEATGLQTVTIGGRDVTYMAVTYSYGSDARGMEFYAWTELSEDVFLLMGGNEDAYGQELQAYTDLPALLETLLDAVQGDVTATPVSGSGTGYTDDDALKVNDDGTYVLEDWMYVYDEDAGEYVRETVTVDIAVPAGHAIDDYSSDSTWLCFDAEIDDNNGYAWVYYSLYADYTAEDIAYYHSNDFDNYSDYYDGVEVTGLQNVTIGGRDVTYMAVTYSYGSNAQGMEFYAWTELSENVFLLVGGNEDAYGRELQAYTDLPALLETLLDAVQ